MTTTTVPASVQSNPGYEILEKVIADRVAAALVAGPAFTTDANPDVLWLHYLGNVPEDRRQHYNCMCCKSFIRTYGGLVAVADDGRTTPVCWESGGDNPDGDGMSYLFGVSLFKLHREVAKAEVTGVFLSGLKDFGVATNTDKKGRVWTHLHAKNPKVHSHPLLTAGQHAAEKKQDYGVLQRSLADFPDTLVAQALGILRLEGLYRSEKAVQVAEWFLGVHDAREKAQGKKSKDAVVWKAVAQAPPGFCHVRNQVLGTLLEDVAAGFEFEDVKKRWAAKLHPLKYQRPQAAPSEGQIDAAEKLVEKLGIVNSLKRRFATLADVQVKLWVPSPAEEGDKKQGGVFDALRGHKAGEKKIDLPAQNITWVKFRDTVLPGAKDLEVLVPAKGGFYGLLTADDYAAPPILQWDGLDGHPRNPVSWYYYQGGSMAASWHLQPATYVPVTAVFLSPHQWQDPVKFEHQGVQVFFALKGAWDAHGPGLCLFPELLKAELRAARSVIEAHSNKAKLRGDESNDANGVGFGKGEKETPITLRVATEFGTATYKLDRWD